MKREIFLRRVRKGPRRDLNFKGELFARKTQGERREGELREERERGCRGSPTATALLGTLPRTRRLHENPWNRILILLPGITSWIIGASCASAPLQGTGTPGMSPGTGMWHRTRLGSSEMPRGNFLPLPWVLQPQEEEEEGEGQKLLGRARRERAGSRE